MIKYILRKISPLVIVLLLTACDNNSHAAYSDTPTPSPSHPMESLPNPDIQGPAKAEDPTNPEFSSPSDSNPITPDLSVPSAPTPSEEQDPEENADDTENQACTHMNYASSFPLIFTESEEIRFHYDDTITITGPSGSTVLSLSSASWPEGQDFSDPDAWFFCGALQSGHMVYAHYDYLNGKSESPSLLLQIDPSACSVRCCILSKNPKKQFGDAFAILGESIYYTSTSYAGGSVSTSIFCTDLNGENATKCIQGMPGETIPFLTTDGDFLYFTVKGSQTRLVCFDPTHGTQDIISSELATPAFLAAFNGFVLTSAANNELNYFGRDGSSFTLTLTEDRSLMPGCPLTDGHYVYIPFISYSSNASTQVAVVDLSSCQLQKLLTLSDDYFYCVGMAGQSIYAESVDEFMVFHLSQEQESEERE